MRTAEIRLRQHAGRHFRAHWMIMSNRRVKILDAVKLLENKGIEIVEPESILTPPVKYEPFELPVKTPMVEKIIHTNEPCFMIGDNFKPIDNLKQSQLITNSLVKDELPSSVQNRITDVSSEEEQSLKECVLYSMTLDSRQRKLPKYIDVHNRPGINLPRDYGLSNVRKNLSLNYKLHVLLVKSGVGEPRAFVEDIVSNTTLNHSGSLFRMSHNASYILCSDKPLSPAASKEEVLASSEEELPDIYPFEPFINCFQRTNYEKGNDSFGLRKKAPHTVFVHNNKRLKGEAEQYYGVTLVNAFSHAAAYAREIYKGIDGDLPEPITLQIVQTTGRLYHPAVFQLNTLKLDGPVKNIFWHEPWDHLFETCEFRAGSPHLEGFNPRPFSILKAFYANKMYL